MADELNPGMQARADQIDAAWGVSFTDPVGAHYHRLVNWGMSPEYAIQLAGALQSHLMKLAEYKIVQDREDLAKATAAAEAEKSKGIADAAHAQCVLMVRELNLTGDPKP